MVWFYWAETGCGRNNRSSSKTENKTIRLDIAARTVVGRAIRLDGGRVVVRGHDVEHVGVLGFPVEHSLRRHFARVRIDGEHVGAGVLVAHPWVNDLAPEKHVNGSQLLGTRSRREKLTGRVTFAGVHLGLWKRRWQIFLAIHTERLVWNGSNYEMLQSFTTSFKRTSHQPFRQNGWSRRSFWSNCLTACDNFKPKFN